jgi:hypothetical protein
MAMMLTAVTHRCNVGFDHFKAVNTLPFNAENDRVVYLSIMKRFDASTIEFMSVISLT